MKIRTIGILFIILVFVLSGCKGKDSEVSDGIQYPKRSTSEYKQQTDGWEACKGYEDFTVLDSFPEVAMKGLPVDLNWTLKDFLATGLVDETAQMQAYKITVLENGEHTQDLVDTTIEELQQGFIGTGVYIMGDGFSAIFQLRSPTFEEEGTTSILDTPLRSLTMLDFTCNGITTGAPRDDVVNTFGPTRWNDMNLSYICGQNGDGYIDFGIDMPGGKVVCYCAIYTDNTLPMPEE